MSRIKLRNKYKSMSRIGALVRVDPNNQSFFEYADINTLPVVGVVVDSRGYKQLVSIDTLGSGSASSAGASAYDVAVSNGFRGTVNEWLLSLKGEDGVDGQQGEQGEMGPQGIQGPKGDTGSTGPQGATGAKGDPGDAGPQGIPGNDGYTPIKGVDYFDGARGVKGDTGAQGLPGYTPIKGVDYFDGAKGDTGAQGLKGDKGDTGSQGPQGIQGPSGSDATVTKSAVESVLTGEISSHSHASSGGMTQAQILTRQL